MHIYARDGQLSLKRGPQFFIIPIRGPHACALQLIGYYRGYKKILNKNEIFVYMSVCLLNQHTLISYFQCNFNISILLLNDRYNTCFYINKNSHIGD